MMELTDRELSRSIRKKKQEIDDQRLIIFQAEVYAQLQKERMDELLDHLNELLIEKDVRKLFKEKMEG